MARESDIGLVGLGVMGRNLALNMEAKGYSVSGYDIDQRATERLLSEGAGKRIFSAYSLPELVASLRRPRKILLMIKAGAPVDSVLDGLLSLLDQGDIVIDGGNSHFRDTDRRYDRLSALGLRYLGTGISGGEFGALHGPSIMPGGDLSAYEQVSQVLADIAARTEDGPCVTYIGPRSAGHYVKMVHNGIEYGVMQVIAEAYDVMRKVLGMSACEISDVFAEWNGEHRSYLMEITHKVLERIDSETGMPLVDLILDTAGQKGTGKWSSQEAFDLGVATPTIKAAVDARLLSAMKRQRLQIGEAFGRTGVLDLGVGVTAECAASQRRDGADVDAALADSDKVDRASLLDDLRDALYLSTVMAYSEGMRLLQIASAEYGYGLKYHEIARIWKAGCIIRSSLLSLIQEAYREDADLISLVVAEPFKHEFERRAGGWRRAISAAATSGVPALAMSAALSHFDSLTSAFLPANLVQGQRDYFGAHTYERIDREGVFHTDWESVGS